MALIRATCEDCGDVELRAPQLKAMRIIDEVHGIEKDQYRFNCPCCKLTQIRNTDSQTNFVLRAAGVEFQQIRITSDRIQEPMLDLITPNEYLDLISNRPNALSLFDLEIEVFLRDPISFSSVIAKEINSPSSNVLISPTIESRLEAKTSAEPMKANIPAAEINKKDLPLEPNGLSIEEIRQIFSQPTDSISRVLHFPLIF